MEKRKHNCVITSDPTIVSHSSVGNFTSHDELNLIVGRCTRLEIYRVKDGGVIESMSNEPIHGRIATLQLYRPAGQAQDLLVLTTEKYKLCVLQWRNAKLITRLTHDVSDPIGRPTDSGMIAIIDPARGLFALHLYNGKLMVIQVDNIGQLLGTSNMRLRELEVLDITFLDGCNVPTIVVLYKDECEDSRLAAYALEDMRLQLVELEWLNIDLERGTDMLIPVLNPINGVLIIGERTVVYVGELGHKRIPIEPSISKVYGIYGDDNGGDCSYLLGDQNGMLHLLTINQDINQVIELEINALGVTSIASSLSYLGKGVAFVGSRFGDSQLISLDDGLGIKVLKRFVNLGPIVDMCMFSRETYGACEAITCSGGYKDSSLRLARSALVVNKKESSKIEFITSLWPIRLRTADSCDTLLIVSFWEETHVYKMNSGDAIDRFEVSEIKDLISGRGTLFCHNVIHNQLVQVTDKCVKLISLTEGFGDEWKVPEESSITVATASATQVLLATGPSCQLILLEVGDGLLRESTIIELEIDISCLDIKTVGDDHHTRQVAAVGMWDGSVMILGVPDLVRRYQVNPEVSVPYSVLLCSLEKISYLFCGYINGQVLYFVVDDLTLGLGEPVRMSLGTRHITLVSFSMQNATHVFAASDRPAIIYSHNKRLLQIDVDLECVTHMCPFRHAMLPDSLLIATEDELVICTIGDTQKIKVISSIPLAGEQALRICHQKETRTFAICSFKYGGEEEDEKHFVHLLNEATFDVPKGKPEKHFISTYCLKTSEHAEESAHPKSSEHDEEPVHPNTSEHDEEPAHPKTSEHDEEPAHPNTSEHAEDSAHPNTSEHAEDSAHPKTSEHAEESVHPKSARPKISEHGCSIISCSFSGGEDVFYCVGTAYTTLGEREPSKGRILIFSTKLELLAEKITPGAVHVLKPFNGKLMAVVNQSIQLFSWVRETGELEFECAHHGHVLPLYVETIGDFIVVGDLMKSMCLLFYRELERSMEKLADDDFTPNLMSAVGILDDETFIGAENSYNIFTINKIQPYLKKRARVENAPGIIPVPDEDITRVFLEVAGQYHLGDFVNKFIPGSLHREFGSSSIHPTLSFATMNGVVGMVVSLPRKDYFIFEMLEKYMSGLDGIGGLKHNEWRQFANEHRTISKRKMLLDGDLIKSFLLLSEDFLKKIRMRNTNMTLADLMAKVKMLS